MKSPSAIAQINQDTGVGPSARHLPALDGVRGLAILLVLMAHLLFSNGAVTQSLARNLALSVWSGGWMGVDLFFVLSGFLITGVLYDSVGKKGYFRNFYARRFLRIFPLYYAVLVALIMLTPLLAFHWNGHQFLLLGYLQNVPPWNSSIPPSIYSYTVHFWSLAVEEQFYLVWPLVVFLLRRRRLLTTAALLLAAISPIVRSWGVFHGASRPFLYEFTPCRMDSLLLGAALALAMRGPTRQTLLRAAPAVFWVVFSGTLFISFYLHPWSLDDSGNGFLHSFGFSLLAIAFSALIACALRPESWAAWIFGMPVLRWFGKYSYGIYVLHPIAYNMIGLGPRHWLDAKFHAKAVGVALGGVPALIITLILAWLSFNFYESKFLRLKRKFEYRGSPARPIASETAA